MLREGHGVMTSFTEDVIVVVHMFLTLIQDVSLIVASTVLVIPKRKPSPTGASRESCGAQGNVETNALYFIS
jgi:hypothetical protein